MNGDDQLIGRVFDIQRMSFHDGPGIRTVVFFKGCNLRCFWCHNPESWQQEREVQFFANRCIGCGACVEACPRGFHSLDPQTKTHAFSRSGCILCGACVRACASGSLVMSGEDRDVSGLVAEVLRDKPFFDNSGGGITASGGEPLLQFPFLASFFQRLKEQDIHTAVDTAFHVPYPSIKAVMPYTDLFIIDLKHPDDDKHLVFTGYGNRLILENIRRLDQTGMGYWIRIPVVPGVNDDPETMRHFDSLLCQLKNPSRIELLPYHAYGLNKYVSLDHDIANQEGIESPSVGKLKELSRAFAHTSIVFRAGPRDIWVRDGGIVCEVSK